MSDLFFDIWFSLIKQNVRNFFIYKMQFFFQFQSRRLLKLFDRKCVEKKRLYENLQKIQNFDKLHAQSCKSFIYFILIVMVSISFS